MAKIKVVFSDVDGTLLNSEKQVSEPTKEGICRLTDQGIPFVLVSSRSPVSLQKIQQQLGIRSPIISLGGGLVLDQNGKELESTVMKTETALQVKRLVETVEPDICCSAYSYYNWYVDDPAEPRIVKEGEITYLIPEEQVLGEAVRAGVPVHKFLCIGEPEQIVRLEQRLNQEQLPVMVCRSHETLLEIMDTKATKSNGIHSLCAYIGISPEDTLSIGDNFNDVDMLKVTGASAVMGNAPDEVKKQASFTVTDNDHDGVLEALRRYFTV